MSIDHLLRKNIRTLKPYSSARLEDSGLHGILLDANENALGSVTDNEHNRYPDPLQSELKRQISILKGVSATSIFVGSGSDEAIDLLIRAFCEPSADQIMICPPTYGVYSVFAAINNVKVVEVPLNLDFDIDVETINQYFSSYLKLIFLCSPNNPTGNLISKDKIIQVLEQFREGLIIIDEAYIDFASDKSWLDSISTYPNLVILQTFSKAWGMANLRLGTAYAQPEIIDVMNRIKYPYNVSGVSQNLGIKALQNLHLKDKMVAYLIRQRDWLQKQLIMLECVTTVFPSEANFLLVRFRNSQRVYRFLLDHGVIVRDRSNALNCSECLRITVGSGDENRLLIDLLKQMEESNE